MVKVAMVVVVVVVVVVVGGHGNNFFTFSRISSVCLVFSPLRPHQSIHVYSVSLAALCIHCDGILVVGGCAGDCIQIKPLSHEPPQHHVHRTRDDGTHCTQ